MTPDPAESEWDDWTRGNPLVALLLATTFIVAAAGALLFLAAFARDLLADTGWFG